MSGHPPLITRHCEFLARGLAALALMLSPSISRAQVTDPPAQGKIVPTLEALPHASKPRGAFKMWCGKKDRLLLSVGGQFEACDGGRKSATIAISSRWPAQCSADGQQLIYVDTRMGYITRIDIANGASRLLASYKPRETGDDKTALSPDLRSIVSSSSLTLAADAGALKIISVKDIANKQLRDIKRSDDSSKIFAAYFTSIDVLDAQGEKIGSGQLPKGFYYRDGWFAADRQALILYLASEEDESGPSALIQCRITDWKYSQLKSRVDSASVGGRGILGTVSPVGKPPPPSEDDDGGTIHYYDRYVAELRDGASNLVARQVRPRASRTDFEINIAPSGMKAALTWHISPTAECPPTDGSSDCAQGILVDLTKVVK